MFKILYNKNGKLWSIKRSSLVSLIHTPYFVFLRENLEYSIAIVCLLCCTIDFIAEITMLILLIRVCVCAQLLSHVRLFVTPWTVVHQAPLSMMFSSQEYWNGLPSATPRGLSNPGSEPMSPACLLLAGRFFATEPPGKSNHHCTHRNYHDL